MIFTTIGTMFPFDRLIKAIDSLVADGTITEPIRAQIGDGAYEPRHMPFMRFMDRASFDAVIAESDMVISHAGIGTISTALAYEKPILVLPRRKRYGEHVNDHQVPTARKYQELGHVLVADDAEDIAAKLLELRAFQPKPRHANVQGLAERIAKFLFEQGETT